MNQFLIKRKNCTSLIESEFWVLSLDSDSYFSLKLTTGTTHPSKLDKRKFDSWFRERFGSFSHFSCCILYVVLSSYQQTLLICQKFMTIIWGEIRIILPLCFVCHWLLHFTTDFRQYPWDFDACAELLHYTLCIQILMSASSPSKCCPQVPFIWVIYIPLA